MDGAQVGLSCTCERKERNEQETERKASAHNKVKDALHVGIYIGHGHAVDKYAHGLVFHLNDAEKVTKVEVVDKCCVNSVAAGVGRRVVAAVGCSNVEE